MVLVSHRHKFIYVKCKKVASTSVEAFFEPFCLPPQESYAPTCQTETYSGQYGFVGGRVNEDLKGGPRESEYGHLPLSKILFDKSANLTADQFKTYYKFCVVRNPWDVQVSFYYFLKAKYLHYDKSFEEHLYTTCIVNSHFYSIDGKPACDFYIRYEALEDDIQKACTTLQIPCDISKLPRFRSNTRPAGIEYRSMYSDRLRDYVAKRCVVEIEKFGYVF
jgi:hypothetical protein